MSWSRIWHCYWVEHNGHTGCGDLQWMDQWYDSAVGCIAMAGILFPMVMLAIDSWQHRRASFWMGAALLGFVWCGMFYALVFLPVFK